VIGEVDSALRALIEREAVGRGDVEVVFDAPTREWAGRRNSPTIDVYLYDIREDLRRRDRGMVNEYDADERRIVARHLPPRYFKLSYLVTAWTQRPEDEHRLLSTLLTTFLRFDALPEELVGGSLAELGLAVPVTVALPPPEDRAFADVWSALGGELKPSIDVVVSAPVDTGQRYQTGPPVTAPPLVSLGGSTGWPPTEPAGRTERTAALAQQAASRGARGNGADGTAGATTPAGRTAARSGAEDLAERAAQALVQRQGGAGGRTGGPAAAEGPAEALGAAESSADPAGPRITMRRRPRKSS
jgi:Pvc16 N-terminal domain